jgi:hypothetical protein
LKRKKKKLRREEKKHERRRIEVRGKKKEAREIEGTMENIDENTQSKF